MTFFIFDAVIKNKLLHGMETVQLMAALISKLDAIQMKRLGASLGQNTPTGIGELQMRAS